MSRRVQRIWISVGLTALGVIALVILGFEVNASRDTDLADASDQIQTEFRHSIPDHAPTVRFADVTAEAGLRFRHGHGMRRRLLPEDMGPGGAWGDYDGDGDPDLYLVNMPDDPARPDPDKDANRLFRNDGGRFTDVTAEAGVGDPGGFGMGAGFADYDGDGDLDLYVTNNGPNRLYRNDGAGRFTDVAKELGVDDPRWSTGIAWGDVDRDGDLDLYVCNYVDYDAGPAATADTAEWEGIPFTLNPNAYDPQGNSLFLNDGAGSFEEAAARLGAVNRKGRSLGATFFDFDGDGWLDLYVANDVSPNVLFRNHGTELPKDGRRFLEISAMCGVADPRGSMGLSVGDVSGPNGAADGVPDLFITHWVAQENALYIGIEIDEIENEFRDRVRQFRLGEISTDTVGWGTAMVDLDLDGQIDIAVANGSTLERKDDPRFLTPEPLFLFWRDGDRFRDLAPAAGDIASGRHNVRGLGAADYDADGDVDLALFVNRGDAILLRNDTKTGNASLTVLLDAPDAARFGARIEVVTGGRSAYRWWGSDVSYLSMHGAATIFGLGEAKQADAVRLIWADGTRSELGVTRAGRVTVVHGR